MGIAEEGEHRVAYELVEGGAVLVGDMRHLREVFVQEFRNLFGLKPFGREREILDVRKEHRQLLALGRDRYILLAREDRSVDLRRQILSDL